MRTEHTRWVVNNLDTIAKGILWIGVCFDEVLLAEVGEGLGYGPALNCFPVNFLEHISRLTCIRYFLQVLVCILIHLNHSWKYLLNGAKLIQRDVGSEPVIEDCAIDALLTWRGIGAREPSCRPIIRLSTTPDAATNPSQYSRRLGILISILKMLPRPNT